MPDAYNILTDPGAIEAELRRRIEAQAVMIQVALGYIKAERPDLARRVLESTGV